MAIDNSITPHEEKQVSMPVQTTWGRDVVLNIDAPWLSRSDVDVFWKNCSLCR